MNDVEQAKALFFEAIDLADAKDYPGAEERLRAALRIVPDRVSALTNLAVALLGQGKVLEAIEIANRSVVLAAKNVDGWLALGSSLGKARLLDDALNAMNEAVRIAPGNARVWAGRASVFTEQKRFDLAIADLETAIALGPAERDLRGLLVSARMQACDWAKLQADADAFFDKLHHGAAISNPFMTLALPSSPADQLLCASGFAAQEYPARPELWTRERPAAARIRVAYVSGDFRVHPLAYLMAGLFEHHDRKRFQTFGISFGEDDGSPLRQRLAQGFERFLDVADLPDAEIASLLDREQIDIAIDLGGCTAGGRPAIFASRPSPIQVSYLGYPGTSGHAAIDYIVADETVIPADQRQYYSEAVVWLPDTYLPGGDARSEMSVTPTRAATGLPETGFVFCAFHEAYKISPAIFDVWMCLLTDIEGSVLWLREINPTAASNLSKEASARGVSPDRLLFAPRVSMEEHLARHRLAGIFLDTPNYNAHSTAADALWMGLPVLTITGQTFAGRAGTSLLAAAGIPELATRSMEEYKALALRLARDPKSLDQVKAKLAANRDTTALFDAARLTRNLEAAYVAMIERYRRGEPPEPIVVGS